MSGKGRLLLGQPQVARCNDWEDDDAAYRAACLLAEAVGVELEDG